VKERREAERGEGREGEGSDKNEWEIRKKRRERRRMLYLARYEREPRRERGGRPHKPAC